MNMNARPAPATAAGSGTAGIPSGAEDSIDLMALFRTLWREKLVILACMLITMVFAGLYAYRLATPLYSASSVVMLDSRQSTAEIGLSSILGSLSTDSSAVLTEVQVLRGRTLMGRVVDALDLMADPEFNAALNPPGIVARLKAGFGLGRSDGSSLAPEELAARQHDAVISSLLGQIAIQNLTGSLAFNIGVTSTSPAKAAKIADTIARLYIDDQMRVRFEATETAINWLTTQSAELKAAFEKAEAAVRDYRASTEVISPETVAAMDRQLKETRRRIEQMAQQSAESIARLAAIEAADTPLAKALAAGDDTLTARAREIATGGEAAVQAFDAALVRFLTQLRQDVSRLQAQDITLKDAEAKLAADLENQSREMVQLEQLTRDAESSRLLYEQFQTQLKETLAQQGIQKPDSRILSPAVVPNMPSAPRKSLILVMALVLGAMIGTAIVLVREMTANRIRATQDLEALTGQAVFAQIPRIAQRSRKGVLDYLGQHPTSAPAEAIRNLRTSLLLSSVDKAPQVIMMTSSVPGEGKTTTTLALAQNMTAMGRKVLVMEGDVRLSPLREYFTEIEKGSPGIVEVISGEIALADAVHKVPGIGDILPESKASVNAADLFSSERFGRMLTEARKAYDFILVDTPPVLVVPDARVIAQNVDVVVFAVRWDSTSHEQVTNALHQLALVNIRVAGLVLTQVDPEGMRRYGYGDSYGAYASYGKSYYTSG